MRRTTHKFLGVLLAVAVLCFLAVCLSFGPSPPPRLSVSYIQMIDDHGSLRARFGITNVGNGVVFTSGLGMIEVSNHTNILSVGASSPLSRLAPGEGQLVDAVFPGEKMASLDGKWRYTCLYARDGLRTRISHWQWGPGGPGPRANWLIPKKLKGMPLTAKGTSDWIQPVELDRRIGTMNTGERVELFSLRSGRSNDVGAANGSQPIRSGTNSASGAAGSRR